MRKKILFLLVVFIFLVVLNQFIFINEGFISKVFFIHPNPNPICSTDNNCFPGTYFRTQKYQNVVEPNSIKHNGLSREKIKLASCIYRQL